MSYNNLRKGRYSQSSLIYHITTVTRDRIPHFESLENGRKLVRQLMALQSSGKVETLCYVVMPDHFHWLMVLHEGTLSDVMKLLKGRTSHAIGLPIWQESYHDHALRNDEDLREVARYIVANPMRAKLVERIGDYSLWDAVWLEDSLSG